MEYRHRPVLPEEAVELLDLRKNGVYADCTLGGAGHTRLILERLRGGRVVGIDRDAESVENARALIDDSRFTAVQSNFADTDDVLAELGIDKVDGLLLDLGVSSHQLDTERRGFSYSADAPLDMRMDASQGATAADLLNDSSAAELARIFRDYGEERRSRRIAAAIAEAREIRPYETTKQLYDTVFENSFGGRSERLSSVKRIFQALRIEVNGELDALSQLLEKAPALLKKSGRIVVISFHSLEDRMVKRAFSALAAGCTCPKDLPVCVCGKSPQFKILTRKPLSPSEEELCENRRSHSARLRAAEKL